MIPGPMAYNLLQIEMYFQILKCNFQKLAFLLEKSVVPSYKSDHSIISIEYNSEIQARGKGFWKVNSSLLHDRDFVEGMNNMM